MANQKIQKKMKNNQEKLDGYYRNIKEEDLVKDVEFEIDKDAFKGPFICHNNKTVLENKKTSYNNLEFNYSIWKCSKCKKEYLDSEQGRSFEKFLILKQLLNKNIITIERSMNYDGKTFFFRFPKELAGNLHKEDLVDIKLLSNDGSMFLVEIKHRHS